MKESLAELSELGLKKSAIRKKKSIARKGLSLEEIQTRSERIVNQLDAHLAELMRKKRILNRVVMGYNPINNEVALGAWLKNEGGQFSEIVFPKVVDKTEMMVGRGKLVKGYQGILEPVELDEELSDGRRPIDVILVPGLAFTVNKINEVGRQSRQGRLGRLGYGGGFYDRFIAKVSREVETRNLPYLIGLFYEDQGETELSLESHDIDLDCVITEAGIYL